MIRHHPLANPSRRIRHECGRGHPQALQDPPKELIALEAFLAMLWAVDTDMVAREFGVSITCAQERLRRLYRLGFCIRVDDGLYAVRTTPWKQGFAA